MLRDATKRDHGLGPLAHEMSVATHLMRRGYEVGFHDLEGGSGFDLLALKGGVSVQVECKHISGDIGRQIHRKELYSLGDCMTPRMLVHLGNLDTGMFLRLTLPGRLHSREDMQEGLGVLVGRAMVSGLGRLEDNGCRVDVQEFNVSRVAAGWASASGVDRGRITAALARHFGMVNKNVLVYVQPGKSATVVAVESKVEDRVLKAIHRILRESSKRQSDGRSPGILCCHLAEVTEEQLVGLRDKGERGIGLDYMTSDLLNRRPNVHSVTYTGQARVREKLVGEGVQAQRAMGETGPAYTIQERAPPHGRRPAAVGVRGGLALTMFSRGMAMRVAAVGSPDVRSSPSALCERASPPLVGYPRCPFGEPGVARSIPVVLQTCCGGRQGGG